MTPSIASAAIRVGSGPSVRTMRARSWHAGPPRKVFSQEEQGISDAFLEPRAQREVDRRFVEGGSEDLNRPPSIALVVLEGPRPVERQRSLCAGWDRWKSLVQQVSGAGAVADLERVCHREDRALDPIVLSVMGGEPPRLEDMLGGSGECAPRMAADGGIVECGGDPRIRAVRPQGEMSGPLLGIGDDVGESLVHGASLPGRAAE